MSAVFIPAKVRGYVYTTFGFLGLGFGATQVGYSAAEVGQPVWLTVALSVYAFLGVGIGYTAASNTPAAPSEMLIAGEVLEFTPDDGEPGVHRPEVVNP